MKTCVRFDEVLIVGHFLNGLSILDVKFANSAPLWRHLQYRHLILALSAWSDQAKHTQFPPNFLDMHACTTSQLNEVLVRKLLCAWPIFDTLSISVCTTRHWQTSGQLVQELNVCTVYVRDDWCSPFTILDFQRGSYRDNLSKD